MKTEMQILHYTIWFGIYLGGEMIQHPEVCKHIEFKEPEEVDNLLREWAREFVEESGEDDSWTFFEGKLSSLIPNRGEKQNPTIYVVTGNSKNNDGSDEEFEILTTLAVKCSMAAAIQNSTRTRICSAFVSTVLITPRPFWHVSTMPVRTTMAKTIENSGAWT